MHLHFPTNTNMTESAQNLWLFGLPETFDVYLVSQINAECPLKV